MKRSNFIPIFLVLMLAACTAIPATEPVVPVTGDSTAATPPHENDLLGSSWQLVSFGPVGATAPVVGETPITLEFGEDGQAGGHGGCNSYGGTYTVQDDSLQFGDITSTLIACEDQAVTEQEQQYLEALRTASRFMLEGDTLEIWYQNDGGVLNFERTSGATPEPPAVTSTSNPVTAMPSPAEPPERIEFDAGTTSTQRSGLLPSGLKVKQYVLTGSAGQTMTVDIFSADVPLSMTITEPSGMQRIPEMFPVEGGGYRIGHEFTLTEDGDYLVMGIAWSFLLGGLLPIGVFGVVFLLYGANGFATLETVFVGDADFSFSLPSWLALVSAVAFPLLNPVVEELHYRGYTQPRLIAALQNTSAGVLLTAVGFGLQHMIFALTISSARAYAAGFFLWGLGAGLIAYRQKRLFPLIIAHFISNLSFGVIPLLMIT